MRVMQRVSRHGIDAPPGIRPLDRRRPDTFRSGEVYRCAGPLTFLKAVPETDAPPRSRGACRSRRASPETVPLPPKMKNLQASERV